MSLQRLQSNIEVISRENWHCRSVSDLRSEVEALEVIPGTENHPPVEQFEVTLRGLAGSYFTKQMVQEAIMQDEYCGPMHNPRKFKVNDGDIRTRLFIDNQIEVSGEIENSTLPPIPLGHEEILEIAERNGDGHQLNGSNGQHSKSDGEQDAEGASRARNGKVAAFIAD